MPIRAKTAVPIPTAPTPALLAAAGVGLVALAPAAVTLPVPYARQEQTQWCWAACTEMVARWLGVEGVRQCELANFLHGRTNCCARPSSTACNKPSAVNDVGRVYRHVGVTGIGPDLPLTLPTLVAELAAGRAVEVGYLWLQGGGHVAVVYGYTAQGHFAVHDPWFGSGFATYLQLWTAYGAGRWFVSYGRFARA
jgi:hypothetical protein